MSVNDLDLDDNLDDNTGDDVLNNFNNQINNFGSMFKNIFSNFKNIIDESANINTTNTETFNDDDIREIYNNAPYRINLSLWRNDDWYLNPMNVSFEKTYNIKRWGHHKWLNIQKDNKYENYVIINVNPRRTISNINFKEVFNNFAAKYKLLFICNNEDDYYHFVSEYLNNITIIPCYICKSFSEICTIISSCKLFIGGLSMFLTIAHATQVQHFVGIKNDCVEQKLYCNIKEVFPTSNMYIEDISRIYKNPDF